MFKKRRYWTMLDTTGDLEEGTHGSGLGRVGVRTQCTDPCFLELTRMDCAETEGSGAPATCQEVDVSKGKPDMCGSSANEHG